MVASGCGETEAPELQVILVLDGLRPDYVTAELMPRLDALARNGIRFTRHHSVFPTVTRVNAASIATGSYPSRHGLMGNTVYFPSVDPDEGLRTSSLAKLRRIEAAGEDLVTAPSLGEAFADAGKRVLAVSSGSKGSAYLLNHTLSGGAILHSEYALPAALEGVVDDRVGPAPPPAEPNAGRNRHAIDMLFEVGLPEVEPDLVLLWLSDPDHTAHEHGIGSPEATEALRLVDGEVGRLVDGLDARGYRFNLFVTSDHGFSTHHDSVDLDDVLEPFVRFDDDGHPDLVRAGHGIYDLTEDAHRQKAIVEALQRAPGVGAIFTHAHDDDRQSGSVAGTLSIELVEWDHPRSAQILVSLDWRDAENEHGWPGTSHQGGTAGHGTTSPWDIHSTLVAFGSDLLEEVVLDRHPTSNVDLAPTVSHLAGVLFPPAAHGRVLVEALAGWSSEGPVDRGDEQLTISGQLEDLNYWLSAKFSTVGEHRYLDSTQVSRAAR
ncbi:MAG: alkaline phosphatase family protein [Acidobacteriota bacterium]|nr:alkaline phosphatase family protein [Acidobacteriota bacterium]